MFYSNIIAGLYGFAAGILHMGIKGGVGVYQFTFSINTPNNIGYSVYKGIAVLLVGFYFIVLINPLGNVSKIKHNGIYALNSKAVGGGGFGPVP